MFFPIQEWHFQPPPNLWVGWFIFGLASLTATLAVGYFVWLLPIHKSWVLLAALFARFCHIVNKIGREMRWYWHNRQPEFIRLDNFGVHFCIYPHSSSLKYTDITNVTHWYVTRAENKRRYDIDVGIIITTRQGQSIHLNLERLIQSDDGITLGTNSGVVLLELDKRLRQTA